MNRTIRRIMCNSSLFNSVPCHHFVRMKAVEIVLWQYNDTDIKPFWDLTKLKT